MKFQKIQSTRTAWKLSQHFMKYIWSHGNAENISHCVLERMNHLLWNDPSLEVRQQACITLEKLNANHIVYQDLLVKFKNLQFTNSESENLEKQPSQESFENPNKSPEQNRSLKKPSIDSQDKLWCLSVVRQLKIMTAQLLPCYINCFEEKDHADVRLLSCHVANDLKLTSSRVYSRFYIAWPVFKAVFWSSQKS